MKKVLDMERVKLEELFNPTLHLVSQPDIVKATDFVNAVKLIEDTFGSAHSGSLAGTEVLKILRLWKSTS